MGDVGILDVVLLFLLVGSWLKRKVDNFTLKIRSPR